MVSSPTESFLDDLAARATIKTYDDISIIAVSGDETLTESQRITVLRKAEQRLISDYPDADALHLRLQTITPPPDEEEDDEETRVLEAQARQDLESDGCPPCYPSHIDVPVRNPPEEYRHIVEYWQSISSTGDVVLCAQMSDWLKFRESQQRLRYRYRNKSFSMFVDKVRECRQAHGLHGNVHLLLDPQQQSWQQNWIEFQDYHLRLHELQRKKRDRLQTELDNIQREATDMDMKGSAHSPHREEAICRSLEYAERNLRWHEVFLCWIEQCRVSIDLLPGKPDEKGNGDQNSSN